MKKVVPLYEDFLSEGKKSYPSYKPEPKLLKCRTATYKFKTLKNKRSRRDAPMWHLLLTDMKTKEIIVLPDWFWYEEGWSQGTGRSEHGYYLNMKFYGGVGNGSGIRSQSAPYITYRMEDHLKELLDGKHYNKDKQKEFNEIKNNNVFPKGTKMAEISNNYDG